MITQRSEIDYSIGYLSMSEACSSLQESRQRTNLNKQELNRLEPSRGHRCLRRKSPRRHPLRVGLCAGLPKSNSTLYLIEASDRYNVPHARSVLLKVISKSGSH